MRASSAESLAISQLRDYWPAKLCDYVSLSSASCLRTYHARLCVTYDMNQQLSKSTLERVQQAVTDGKLTAAAAENMRAWLTESRYAAYADEVAAHVAEGKWQALDDVFWTVIPFGTGGRRGQDVPDRLERHQRPHDRRECAGAGRLCEGHAWSSGAELSCAIGFDTRHKSDHFARLCAEIMTAAGFTVYFLGPISGDAGTVVHGAREEVLVRHHGDGEPQSAQR